jgi:hypothetical protein
MPILTGLLMQLLLRYFIGKTQAAFNHRLLQLSAQIAQTDIVSDTSMH